MKKAFLLIIAVLLLFNCKAAYATGTIYYNYYETRYTYILGETVNEGDSFSGNANSEGFLSTPGVETYPSSVLSDFTWTYNETSNSKHYYSVYDKTGTIYRRTGTIQIEAVAAEIGTTSIKFGAGGSFHVQYWDCQVNSPVFTITVISNNYSVNLHANGGYCEKTSHSVVYDYPYSKEENLPVPTREGYIFLGWYTAPSDGIQITDTTVFNNRADVINKRPITLYAHWEPVSYTVTYSGSAAGVTNVPAGQTKLHGQALQLSDQVPEREGHHFLGWGTNPDNNVVSYQPGDTFSLDEDSTLYAVWERFFTIIYDANGGTGAPTAQTKLQGETLMLSSSEPSRSDTVSSYTISLDPNGGLVNTDSLTAARTTSYRFTEWNTVSDGSRTAYAPSASYTADADAVLYAQWVSSSVTESVMLPTPTREGYTFKGWAEDRDADGGIIGNYTPNGNVTLYALWGEIPSTYTVSYNANGGEGEPTSQTKIQGTELTLSSSVPTRSSNSAGSYTVTLDPNGGIVDTSSLTAIRTSSYSFENWNTRSDGSGTGYAPGASYTKDEDATLFAMWNESTLTEAVALPTPTQSDCTFNGWAEDRDADSGVVGSYTPSGDVTLYALWEEDTDEYEIIFPTFLTTIGEEAFANSAFTSVLVPESVTSIGSRAFADCKNLKKIIFANGNLDVAGDFVSGCPLDLVIEAPEGSTVANNLELYFRYICPLPEDPDRPEHTPRF